MDVKLWAQSLLPNKGLWTDVKILSGVKEIWVLMPFFSGLLWLLSGKDPAWNAGAPRFDPWVGKIPWRRKWQLTPGFLSSKSHGQRSLAGYRPRDCKESDITEWLSMHAFFFNIFKWKNFKYNETLWRLCNEYKHTHHPGPTIKVLLYLLYHIAIHHCLANSGVAWLMFSDCN